MVSEHAMLILILLLAVAVVILAIGIMIQARKVDEHLKLIAKRVEEQSATLKQPHIAE